MATGASTLPPPQVRQLSGASFMRFAGLVSIADWIGSNKEFFPYRGGVSEHLTHDITDTAAYFAEALNLAERALDHIGWRGQRPQSRTFTEIFPFKPRGVQKAVIGALQDVRSPVLLLIEAPMGEGKTEAALYGHHLLQQQVGHRGLYFALPTQATSNEMFKRVCEFLAALGFTEPPDLQLIHGAAVLSKDFQELRLNVDEEGKRRAVVASEWFTPKKQGLLSPHGVGTVDQALYGVLNVGHHFVRLYGLANRTIVFDEIHAYELYTGKLIQRLIAWLRALGSSVILLSATLPRGMRQELLAAFGAEVNGQAPPYPRLTRASEEQVLNVSLQARELRYELSEVAAEPESLAGFLVRQSEGGGAVGCVVNTVARAQAVYSEVRARLAGVANAPELILLHARFPAWQREAITKQLMQRVGAKTAKTRHVIVVATQVVEQSIDADFDVLVSDLAPLDLLLQRAGRLYRHDDPDTFQRPRPSNHDRARLYIAGLAREADVPDLSTFFWDRVYAPAVLLRTWALLRDRSNLCLPDNLNGELDAPSLLEQVYSEADLPGEFSADFRAKLDRAQLDLQEERRQEAQLARDQLLPHPDVLFDQPKEDRQLKDDDDPAVHEHLRAATRLGEPSVTVIPLFRRDGALYLNRVGGEPVRLTRKPTLDEAKALLRHAVGLSNRTVYHHLAHQEPPPGWRASALLRHARMIELDNDEYAVSATLRLRLDPLLGIEYLRDKK